MLLVLPLQLRDFDRLRRRLEDLRLDDPRLRFEEDEVPVVDPTDKSFFPFIDAGDLGGRWFGAIIIFAVFVFKEFGGGDTSTLLLNMLIVNLAWFILARSFGSSDTIACQQIPKFLLILFLQTFVTGVPYRNYGC